MALLANLTLQKRVSFVVLAGLIIGLGLFSWLGIQSLNQSTQRILDERLTIARLMANYLDETLGYVLAQLQNTNFSDRLPPEGQFSPVASSLRNTLAKSGITTRHILLIDGQGKVLQTEPKTPGLISTDMSTYPEIKRALETGLSTISNLVTSPLIEAPVVLATTPILNDQNEIIGAFAGAIDIKESTNDAFGPVITVGTTGYTEIVDGNGVVLARSRPGSPPGVFENSDHSGRFAELIRQQRATGGVCHRCHETSKGLERRRDVLAFAPLSTASWGVAIRQSEEEALAPTKQLGERLLLLGLILLTTTFLLVWIMMQGIVNPIQMLTAAVKRVAAGDFKSAIPVDRKDEIGQLSNTFYTMTQQLARSRDELISRNQELSALNSIAITVNQSLDLKKVLENALQKVLEVTKTTAGGVFLKDAESNKLELVSYIGPSSVFQCQEAGLSLADCACQQVLRSGQTMMVNDISQCPMLSKEIVKQEGIDCFVSVPLKSKDKTLGIMNVACAQERYFTENDFRLLDSIGYHVGLAIENSTLYEGIKQKEELRGQLLSRVITAQEEERKRIARELHDEYGQTLTGLLMSIESLENMTLPQQSPLREKLKNAKSLVTHALEEMRRLTLDLRPSALDDLGLAATIHNYAQSRLETVGVQVKFKSKGLNQRLAPTVETTLFRIVQEAINNITKHAQAHNVSIQLEAKNGKITAIIEDDGIGFNVDTTFKSRIGTPALGLLGIQERTTLLGGTFSIKSQPGQGTRLTVEIPLAGVFEGPNLAQKR